MLLINDIKLEINDSEDKLLVKIEKLLRCKINSYYINRKSLDARKNPIYVYSVIVDVDNEDKYINNKIIKYHKPNLNVEYIQRDKTVIVIGYGPSGLFSAYRLTKAGFKVKVFERGKRIAERKKDVESFFKEGILNENSNVQYGEGGAGTFSDAKLTTRIKDKYVDYILDTFVEFGADPSIKYMFHPHLGTDVVSKIIENITDYLITQGCEFYFDEQVTDFEIDETSTLKNIITTKGTYEADYFILGIGHSSYDTVCKLAKAGVYYEKKDIALGFRVEHPQKLINERQTKGIIEDANEYFLRYKGEKGVYSFCMCPGGIVVPAMSNINSIVTNGMSYSKRDSGIANSAILIQIPKEEFDDGYLYLKNIESKAYEYSNSYKALAQNIKDFMNNELNNLVFNSTYSLGTVLYNFNDFFNEKDLGIIKDALRDFDRKIPGFISEGIMVGPETRSSCPIRIKRNEKMMSINTNNLYPIGEGAGYGGGIISCSLDGIRVSNIIINDGKL